MAFNAGKNCDWRLGIPHLATDPQRQQSDKRSPLKSSLFQLTNIHWTSVTCQTARDTAREKQGRSLPIGWMTKQMYKGVEDTFTGYKDWAVTWILIPTPSIVLPPWAPGWRALADRTHSLLCLPWLGQSAWVKELRAVAQPPGESWGQCLPRAKKGGQGTFLWLCSVSPQLARPSGFPGAGAPGQLPLDCWFSGDLVSPNRPTHLLPPPSKKTLLGLIKELPSGLLTREPGSPQGRRWFGRWGSPKYWLLCAVDWPPCETQCICPYFHR